MTHTEAHESHESHSGLIWRVFIFLSIVTTIEVLLGIYKPEVLHIHGFGMSWLNLIFIILTLVKAYGIAWFFMHLKQEKASLRRVVVWTALFLIAYLSFIVLVEGNYMHERLLPYLKW